MMGILESQIDGKSFLLLVVGLVIIGFFVYREWPEFRARVSKKAVDDKCDEIKDVNIAKDIASIKSDIATLKEDIKDVKEKQMRDYKRLNSIDEDNLKQRKAIKESLTERKLLMRGIMACLDGLEQLNCNHTVPETKKAISDYLNDAAHDANE